MRKVLKKERIDKLLVNRGFVESREKAQRLIMSGVVFVNGERVDKPGTKVKVDAQLQIKQKDRYVSRGGYKLEKALRVFKLNVSGKVCIDIGASTGGFTDCLLQHGAGKVYAVDVGKNQLHEKLKRDSRVISLEKTNARYLTPEIIPEKIQFFVCDVSFISVLKVLPNICDLLEGGAEGVVLIKPQFELSKKEVKDGVVRDPSLHIKAVDNVLKGLENSCFCIKGLDFSETWGPEGNIEFLAFLQKDDTGQCKDGFPFEKIQTVVMQAHKKFRER